MSFNSTKFQKPVFNSNYSNAFNTALFLGRILLTILALIIFLGFIISNFAIPNAVASQPSTSNDASSILKNDIDKVSYSIGVNVGKNISRESFEIDSNLFLLGVKDGLLDQSILTDNEIDKIIMDFQQREIAKHEAKYEKLAENNLVAGRQFLKENQSKKDVKTTPSGLQYIITKSGEGLNPTLEDIVTVNYVGTLIDGTEFDNSHKRKKPTSFKLKNVIKGWQEGIQLINTGSKITLFIPSELAYGSTPPSPLIGPNSVLIFDVELLKIEKPMH